MLFSIYFVLFCVTGDVRTRWNKIKKKQMLQESFVFLNFISGMMCGRHNRRRLRSLTLQWQQTKMRYFYTPKM